MGRRPRRRPLTMANDNHNKIDFLSIGSVVEVSSDDEGFNGAWYVAKILKPIHKCKGKFLIQYQTLLSDKDPDVLLSEIVDIAFIRPLPPPREDDQSYEVHDVVDAFHRDGWWKGVVSKVEVLDEEKGKCSKYSVVFENPPEKFDFRPENLRFHFIWTDGKWVQPPRQKRMQGLNIDKGMTVEVNLNGEILKSVWLPAIVVEEVGFNSFLVEYSKSINDGKDCQIKETIDSFRIRPPPPKLEVQNEILECVEAFHDSCWKKGITVKTLTQGRCSFFFFLDSEEEEIQVRKTEIRPHLLWMNGTWTGFREVPNRTQCEEQPAYVDNIAKHSDVVISATSSITAKVHNEEKSSCKRTSDGIIHSKDKSSVKKSRNNPLDIQKENKASGLKDKGIASKMELEDCVGSEIEFSLGIENADVMVKTLSIVPITDHTTEAGAYVETLDDRVPPRSFGSDREGNGEIVYIESDGIGHQDKDEPQNVYEGAASEMDFEDSNKEVELSDMENGDFTTSIVAVEDHIAKVGGSCDPVNGERDGSIVTVNQCSEIVREDSEQLMIQELPFTKSSSFWTHVDSEDIFQFLPQKPHFSPLFECNRLTREGLAIGHMVTFADLVRSIAELQVTDPRKTFDAYLEALADLEKLGFDVKSVVHRINELLSIKTSEEQLSNESKEIHSKIAQYDGEKEELDGEINAIEKMISELRAKQAVKVSEKAMKDSKSSCLKMDANRIKEEISKRKLDFGSLVATPW